MSYKLKIASILVGLFLLTSCKVQIIEKEIGEFSLYELSNIDDLLENYTPAEAIYLEKYGTPEEAATSMEEIWIRKIYRNQEEYALDDRPYIVSEDKENNLWLIEGNTGEQVAPGGTHHAVVSKEDGKVIIFWGDE